MVGRKNLAGDPVTECLRHDKDQHFRFYSDIGPAFERLCGHGLDEQAAGERHPYKIWLSNKGRVDWLKAQKKKLDEGEIQGTDSDKEELGNRLDEFLGGQKGDRSWRHIKWLDNDDWHVINEQPCKRNNYFNLFK